MEIFRVIFLYILALVFAFLEIEIEGKYAWSEKTQTWYRYDPKALINKFFGQIQLLLGFILLTIISNFILVPVYKKWYWKMRESDDRDKLDIFHD